MPKSTTEEPKQEQPMPERGDGFIPDQVRRQIERANELQRELIGQQEPTEPPEDEPPADEPPESPPPPPVELPPAAAPATDWEQRYRTLQGKYDSETGAMRGQIVQMERLLATMQAPPPPSQHELAPGKYNDADVELYGQDLLDAAQRAADAKYASVISQLQTKISHLEGSQAHMTGAAQQDRVFRELDSDPELAGRWRSVNVNPGFMEWLQGIDEFSGLPRNTMIQHAYTTGDAMRTGRFFKKYMAEHTVIPPSPAAAQTGRVPAPSMGNGYAPAGGPRLEDLAAPGRAAGSSPGNGAPQARLWSRSEIKAFYSDRTRGKYRGREAEADRLEADLFAAEAQGRIV